MLYLDTSLIVSLLTNEPTTARVRTWLHAREAQKLFISDWIVTEFSSALSVNIRTGRITTSQRKEALLEFERFRVESLTLLPVESLHFRTAARYADHHQLVLRSGDALHLAVASERSATVCTLDRRLAEAGPLLGVPTELLS